MLATRFARMREKPVRYAALDPAHLQAIQQYIRFALRGQGMGNFPGGLHLRGVQHPDAPWRPDQPTPNMQATMGSLADTGEQVDAMALADLLNDHGYGQPGKVSPLHHIRGILNLFSGIPGLRSLGEIGGGVASDYQHGWQYLDRADAHPRQPREFIPHLLQSLSAFPGNKQAQQIGDYDSDILKGHLHRIPDLYDVSREVMEGDESHPWNSREHESTQNTQEIRTGSDELQHTLHHLISRRVIPRMLGEEPGR